MALSPTDARVHTIKAPDGTSVALEAFNPSSVMVLSVDWTTGLLFGISDGVHHTCSPPQYSARRVSGVPPDTQFPILPSERRVHGSLKSENRRLPMTSRCASPFFSFCFAAMRSSVRAIARSAAASVSMTIRYRNLELIELRLSQGLVPPCTTRRRDSKIVFTPRRREVPPSVLGQ